MVLNLGARDSFLQRSMYVMTPLYLYHVTLDFLAFFPERKWAIQVPVTIGVILLTVVLVFVGQLLYSN